MGSVKEMNGRQWLVVRASSSAMVSVLFFLFPFEYYRMNIMQIFITSIYRRFYFEYANAIGELRNVKRKCCLNLEVRLAGMTSGSGAEAHVPDAAVGIII